MFIDNRQLLTLDGTCWHAECYHNMHPVYQIFHTVFILWYHDHPYNQYSSVFQ